MATVKQFNNTVIEELVDIDKNIFAPLQHDKIIKYLICATDEKIVNMQEIVTATGEPFDIFRAYTPKEAIRMMCGLTYPIDRLEMIHKRVEDNREAIIKNISGTNISLNNNFDFLTSAKNIEKKADARTRDDIFKKYL